MEELLADPRVPPRDPLPALPRRRPTLPLLLVALAAVVGPPSGARAAAPLTRPHEVVVGYAGHQQPRVLHVHDVAAAIRRLHRRPGVRYAVPNVMAHVSGDFIPNDPGRINQPGGWTQTQWNFIGLASVNAPAAWGHLIAAGRPGGRGVVVAVLDTGIAYRRFGRTPASPDLAGARFVKGWDFIGNDPYANDHNGHGTHVASTIAERTNNGVGLTGLAYGATIMPVKVLDDEGLGDAVEIAKGIRFATKHGAQVINLSLELSVSTTAQEIPQLLDAIAYAHSKGVVVVAASGNEAVPTLAYPARASDVLSVGATTEHACLSDYSNQGNGLDLVAPGGGPDADRSDAGCQFDGPGGRNITQLTLTGIHRNVFGYPSRYEGTSMAVPHVSATAALVIASGILGPHPTPTAVAHRLEQTAHDLGPPGYDTSYGYGLVDAGGATDPAIPVG